jgi:hypothetical protein
MELLFGQVYPAAFARRHLRRVDPARAAVAAA